MENYSGFNRTCCSADCPETDNRIIAQICEIFYPFGSRTKCNRVFQNWLKEEKRVQEIHKEYLENKGKEKTNEI